MSALRNVQFRNLYITGAFNAVEMECGPSINGGDSGCWYNAFYTVRAQARLRWSRAECGHLVAVTLE